MDETPMDEYPLISVSSPRQSNRLLICIVVLTTLSIIIGGTTLIFNTFYVYKPIARYHDQGKDFIHHVNNTLNNLSVFITNSSATMDDISKFIKEIRHFLCKYLNEDCPTE